MSGNDPLPTGTPIGDWGFCDHKGCTGRVPIERDSLLCDEHWEAEIRADERELGAALNAALLRDLRADLRAKAGNLPRRYRKEHGKWLITVDVADLASLWGSDD